MPKHADPVGHELEQAQEALELERQKSAELQGVLEQTQGELELERQKSAELRALLEQAQAELERAALEGGPVLVIGCRDCPAELEPDATARQARDLGWALTADGAFCPLCVLKDTTVLLGKEPKKIPTRASRRP